MATHTYIICFCIFKILLPCAITISYIFRPCIMSYIYLLFLLVLPIFPVPSLVSMKKTTGIYLKILLAVSIVTGGTHLVFQAVVLSSSSFKNYIFENEVLENNLRYIGLVVVNNLKVNDKLTWITPEIIMLAASTSTFVVCSRTVKEQLPDEPDQSNHYTKPSFIYVITQCLFYICVCFTAITEPSMSGALLLLLLLVCGIYWAKFDPISITAVLCYVMVITTCSLLCLNAYQFDYVQDKIGGDGALVSRILGWKSFYTYVDNDKRISKWASLKWTSFMNPINFLCLHYISALLFSYTRKLKKKQKQAMQEEEARSVDELEEKGGQPRRVRIHESSINEQTTEQTTSLMTKSSNISSKSKGAASDITSISSAEEPKPTFTDNLYYIGKAIFQSFIRFSYIAANISMMVWSISYFSWLTFVFLLFANILWLVPQKRENTLKCSPLLVIYAYFLLVCGYIYSMELENEELPAVVHIANLIEIGFSDDTMLTLFFKCLFTSTFLLTLRVHMKKKIRSKKSASFIKVTVNDKQNVKMDRCLFRMENFLMKLLTRLWIWIVAITLFVVAIIGEHVTAFKIIYMCLFVIFVLVFQLSFTTWRRILLPFWLTVIICSMIMLLMVYTYQFMYIPQLWNKIGVPYKMRVHLGLKKFKTTELFARLFTPTFFIIIAAIQLHTFHNPFMRISDPKMKQQGGGYETEDIKSKESTSGVDLTDLANVSTSDVFHDYKKCERKCVMICNMVYLFLDIHMNKVVFLVAMLLSAYNACTTFLPIVMLISLSLILGRPFSTFALHIISIIVYAGLLIKMIYQLEYIDHNHFTGVCPETSSSMVQLEHNYKNATYNIMEWIGFKKMTNNSLANLLKWEIAYIVTATIWSAIRAIQYQSRASKGLSTKKQLLMFPDITRPDADTNVKNCIKYLLNYGYYKFGVEVSFMALTLLIGIRMDLCAIIHSFWLIILFSMKRKMLARVWRVYLYFIAVSLPVQYFLFIGIPPFLCFEIPWAQHYLLHKLQDYAFIFNIKYGSHPSRLMCDFVLLEAVSRQAIVFGREKRFKDTYPGGSNESIIHHFEEKGFVNPVPDYVTYTRSYLDIYKRAVMFCFLWLTMVIMFITGTTVVNIYSLGYLTGCFAILWLGNELYLRSIPSILKLWSVLLTYNAIVILLKACLQIVGCIFFNEIPKISCWIAGLFALGCFRWFDEPLLRHNVKSSDCIKAELGMPWDLCCFCFLLIQRRLFQSYYFFHIIDDTKLTTIMASRGAELINELRTRKIKLQQEYEQKLLNKISTKIDKIRDSQRRIQGPNFVESTNHFVVIRSGDYYMFDDKEDDLDIIQEHKLEPDKDLQSKSGTKRYTVGELLSTAMKTDIATSLRVTSKQKLQKNIPDSHDTDMAQSLPGPSNIAGEKKKTAIGQNFVNFILFIVALFNGSMISIANILNKYSRDLIYIRKILGKEKKLLKEKTNYSIGKRIKSNEIWQPNESHHTLLERARKISKTEQKKKKQPTGRPQNINDDSFIYEDIYDYEEEEISSHDQPAIVLLLIAIWHTVESHSDILCYFMIFLNQTASASLLAMPLPLLVLLWGNLGVPRSSKTFWVIIIVYTELIVVIKCIFQSHILMQNHLVHPLYSPSIVGAQRRASYAVWDLLVLLFAFFHRYILKSLGLWKARLSSEVELSDGRYKIKTSKLVPVERTTTENKQNIDLARLVYVNAIDELKQSPRHKSRRTNMLKKKNDNDNNRNKKQSSFLSANAENIVFQLHSDEVTGDYNVSVATRMTLKKYAFWVKMFFVELCGKSPSRVPVDVYSFMFFCDFFNFFVILFGYGFFGTYGAEGITTYIKENRFPWLFVLLLFLQFTFILIDRAIYLRKNIIAKLVYQYFHILTLHIWLFFLTPLKTDRAFNSAAVPPIFYMVKCIYLLTSAYQIRSGYPTRILGNFFCKGYGYINIACFKAFMAIPFLFELRIVMDWMWTDSSFTFLEWLKMEDIFVNIYTTKCFRYLDREYTQPTGEKVKGIWKYLVGIVTLVILLSLIWFPLVFFSLGSAVGEPNIPFEVSLDLRLGPFQPLYQITARHDSIHRFETNEYKALLGIYVNNKEALNFLQNYQHDDIVAVTFIKQSASEWSITPPERDLLTYFVNSTNPMYIRLLYTIHQTSASKGNIVIRGERQIQIPAFIDNERNPARQQLYEMLMNAADVPPVKLDFIFPKFLKVTHRGLAISVDNVMSADSGKDTGKLRSIGLKMSTMFDETFTPTQWWEIEEFCDNPVYYTTLKHIPHADCQSIVLYIISDRKFSEKLGIFIAMTGTGIISMYAVYFFLVFRLIRTVFLNNVTQRVWLTEMPNPDRIYALIMDIYLVRAMKFYHLEERLFAKLLFLMRSRELVIKMSRRFGDAYNPTFISDRR